jgi:hypothetical protein
MASLEDARAYADAILALCRDEHEWETVVERKSFLAHTQGARLDITVLSSGEVYPLPRSRLAGAMKRILEASEQGKTISTTLLKETWLASYILRLYNEVVTRAKRAQGLA